MSGWEPATVTRYEYDEPPTFVSVSKWRWLRVLIEWAWSLAHPPRLLSSVTEQEPEWCRADVEALVAFIEMGRVGPHGQPMSEATSRDADPSNPNRTIGYDVEVWTDFAQKRLNDFKRAFKKQYGDDVDLDDYRFIVKRTDLTSTSL